MFVTERFHLDKQFCEELHQRTPPFGFGPFSEAVYFRTYSRIKEDGTQEQWADTIIRVVEGVLSIRKDWYAKMHIAWDETKWGAYAKQLAEYIFTLKMLPPGRGLWAMGTEYVYERGSMSLNNCGYVDVTNNLADAAAWAMDALMLGVGVGISTQRARELWYVSPPLNTVQYQISDTREGWVAATKSLITGSLSGINYSFDYSQIRPAGQPLKGFGGISSGPKPLIKLHERIRQYFNEQRYQPNTTKLVADVMNAIGACVVSGNIRRSAELLTGSITDDTFINLKNHDRFPDRQNISWMSNNSVVLDTSPSFEYLPSLAVNINNNGEPGIINLINVQKYGRVGKRRDDAATGFNPCAEIPLESKELCCLVEVFPTHCESIYEFWDVLEFATFYASTVSLLPTHDPETNAVMARNRRIGVSVSGIADWLDATNLSQVTMALRKGYEEHVAPTNTRLAREAGVPASIRLTTVKPSGCWKADSLVSSQEGIFRFDEIVDASIPSWQGVKLATNAHTRQGNSLITRGFNNGTVPTKKITTSDGFELEVSLQHPLCVLDPNDKMVWKKASELKIGDRLLARLGQYDKQTDASLIPLVWEGDGRSKPFHGTNKMHPELAWFIGLFFGDGSVHAKGIRISFNRKEADLVNWLSAFVEREFGLHATVDDDHSFYVNSVHLLSWLKINGLLKEFSHKLRVPFVIRTSSSESITSFIGGFWRADGSHFNQTNWTLCSVSKEFAQEMGIISRAVGFNVHLKNAGPGGKGSNDRWILSMRSSDKTKDRYRSKDFRKRAYSTDLWVDPLSTIVDSESLTLDVEVDDVHEYTAQSFVSHNTISLLAGVSPGMHWPIAHYAIRRIRIADNSPLIPILEKAGYYNEVDTYSDNTLVFEFPVYVGNGQTRPVSEVSVWEQASLVAMLQREWADNAVSNTLTFRRDEARQIERVLAAFAPSIKSMSMLPDQDERAQEQGLKYAQPPYTAITKEQYEDTQGTLRALDWRALGGYNGVGEEFCDSDACEIAVPL